MTGEELRDNRVSWNLSQAELAILLDVTVGTVWAWEAGRRRITSLAAIAIRAVLRPRVACPDCERELAPGMEPTLWATCEPCALRYLEESCPKTEKP